MPTASVGAPPVRAEQRLLADLRGERRDLVRA